MGFASGNEVASFVTSSRVLCRSWSAISSSSSSCEEETVGIGLSWKVSTEKGNNDSDVTIIIAFKATTNSSDINIAADLVSSSLLKEENFLCFEFLCSRRYPHFSLNKTAVSLFRQNHLDLHNLKSKISSYNPVARIIVTGHALGGAVASLFTISLLPSIASHKKRLLCITFGSPLVGDKKLQQAISSSSNWNSCFLHVVSHRDPLPRLFITNPTSAYMPFGSFIVCSSATSFENPDSVLEIFMAFNSIHDPSQRFQSIDYGNIVENLYHKATFKDFSSQFESKSYADSLATGISLQLQALGLTLHMQNSNINILETKLEELEENWIFRKRISFDASKELSEMKICMAQLEWFKKTSKDQQIGYYDCYKNNKYSQSAQDAVKYHKMLTTYWEKMVEEAEMMMPQKEGAALPISCLIAGTNYRRMVEPLAIAQYYRNGGKDYVNKQRSKHFKLLEEWLKEGTKEVTNYLNISSQRENVEAILTKDSCFWAHVEEAIHSCSRKFEAVKEKWVWDDQEKLLEFEAYVYGLIKDYAVSPEIFLAHSSYMKWWNQYSEIMGYSYTSPLVNFMNNGRESYARDFEHRQERKLYRTSDYAGWKMFRKIKMASLKLPEAVSSPSQDSERIRKAVEGYGTDEKELILVLGHRNAQQRKEIRETYKQLYNEELIDRLQSELSGDFRKAMILWTRDPPVRDAKLAKKALKAKKKGIKELQVLVEIACASTPNHLVAVRQEYCSLYDCSLEEDIIASVSKPLTKLLVSLVSSCRYDKVVVNAEIAKSEAEKLHEAIKNKELDDDHIVWILSTRNVFQLRETFACYKQLYGKTFEEDIKNCGKGDMQSLLTVVVGCIDCPEKHFAKVVRDSILGFGTDEDSLNRAIVTRAEVDLLKVRFEYANMYKSSLDDDVIGDTSGDYKDFLMTLLGKGPQGEW